MRAFRAALRPDPNRAMCFWGEALALGPNINMPMETVAEAPAAKAMARALELAPTASAREQALIAALAKRYGPGDRVALDEAYAAAMREVAAAYPDDHDIGALLVEALMGTQLWDYWEADRRAPKGHAEEAIAEIGRTSDFSAQVAAYVPVLDLLQMAWHMVRARAAQSRGEPDAALADVRAAATIRAALPYMEPAYWYYPARCTEGVLLLQAGRPGEAVDAFMASLVEAPNDGRAL